MALTYEQFMNKVGDKKFYKFINNTQVHHGFKYQKGLNIDTKKFLPEGSCMGGGLYFTDFENVDVWMHYGVYVAPIKLCEDALFYIEPCKTKYKTNKFIVDEMYNSNLDVDKPPLDICKISLIKNWKNFYKLNYYSFDVNNEFGHMMSNEMISYNKAIAENNNEILSSVDRLIKNDFNFYIENDNMKPLFEYLSTNDNLCVAGNYLAMQYLGNDIANFMNRDIDIFIFGTDQIKNVFASFLDFMDKKYKITSMEIQESTKKNKICDNTFYLKFNLFPRNIQITITNSENIAKLLNSFPFGHYKCCLYKNNTYITYDAKIAKETKYTCRYGQINYCKYFENANNFGITILNFNNKMRHVKNVLKKQVSIEQSIELIDLIKFGNNNLFGGYG
jgi:hypothetical protein